MGKKQVQPKAAVGLAQDVKVKPQEKQQQQQQPKKQQKQQKKDAAGGLHHYTSFLQVLVLDIDHTSPSVLLFFDKERYLFNAGEGIQRLFREHRIKITQIDSYLVTRISTETLGGLAGMALAVVPPDSGGLLEKQAVCHVKGPRGLADYVNAFRGYINHENHVAVEEFDASQSAPVVQSQVVTITPIVVRVGPPSSAANGGVRSCSGEVARVGEAPAGPEGGEAPADSGPPPAKRQRTGAEAGEAPQQQEAAAEDPEGCQRPADPRHSDVVVYCVQLAGRPGKFDPDKAQALGITPGPAYGKLQRGSAITLDDGRVVQPEEVMEPPAPGPSLLLLDTPTPESLAAVAADERLKRFVADSAASASGDAATSPSRLCVAVHLVSPAVAADRPALESWRDQVLGPSWRHVLVAPGAHHPSSIPRASVFQAKLHALSPTCFPLMALSNSDAPPQLPEAELEAAAAAAAKETAASGRGKGGVRKGAGAEGGGGGSGGGEGDGAAAATAAAAIWLACQPPVLPLPAVGSTTELLSAVRVNVMPPARQGLQYNDVFKYDSSSKVLEAVRSDPAYGEVLASAAQVHQAAAEMSNEPISQDRRQLELTLMGTASSQPSKFRNVSGCYVDLFDRGGLLVDCGEDTMGQMKRRFGAAEAERRLGEGLVMVWVSHMHADHHGGLYRLLEWRARRGLPPLLVVGPGKLFEILTRYSAAVPMQFIFMRNIAVSRPNVGRPPPRVVTEAFEAAVRRLGLRSLTPFCVEHIFDAHGLRLAGEAGWVVVFSGDTRPCEQTVEAARGATLLVHEATFEERMVGEAKAKKHSTTAEAVAVGEQAGAYRTLLTHFSTRYPTLPELDLSPHPSVAVAMDLMTINLADLPWLPRLVQPMGQLFKLLEGDKQPDDDDE